MINYHGVKYSVPIQYVGKNITVIDDNTVIHLYYNKELIYSYKKNTKFKFNYKEDDYINILKNSSFNNQTENQINEFIKKNIYSLDGINIERNDKNDRRN